VNRKDKKIRFEQDYEHSLDDGVTKLIIKQADAEQDVGSTVWTAAIMLSKYMEHHYGTMAQQLQGRECIELGSGTGLVGLVLASLGATVTLTDLEFVLPRLQRNILLNTKGVLRVGIEGEEDTEWSTTAAGGKVRARELTWGKEGSLDQLQGPFQLVVACEVIYEKQHIEILLETLRGLVTPETELLFAYDTRGRVGIQPFLEAASSEFSLWEERNSSSPPNTWKKISQEEELHPNFRFRKVKLLRGALKAP